MESIWQLKMTSGAELFADILDWGEETGVMMVQNALSIHRIDNPMGASYYTLRPYMTGTTNNQRVSFNEHNVEGMTIPSKDMVQQYLLTVENMVKEAEEIDEEESTDEPVQNTKEGLENIIKGDFGKKPVH